MSIAFQVDFGSVDSLQNLENIVEVIGPNSDTVAGLYCDSRVSDQPTFQQLGRTYQNPGSKGRTVILFP